MNKYILKSGDEREIVIEITADTIKKINCFTVCVNGANFKFKETVEIIAI